MITKQAAEDSLSELIEHAAAQERYWTNQRNRYMNMLYGISHPGSWEASEYRDDIARFMQAAQGGETGAGES